MNLLDITDLEIGNDHITLNELRWTTYDLIIIRSLLLISISTIKSLYDSYHVDQLTPIPPDEDVIQQFEATLHIPLAIESFHEYLSNNE